ncbi:MAG: hypothetical protein CGU28_01980 [Candidatus Dactylopiibacterium carminicum]|uniref:Uncharacterized protein n=1 Tax=Candidatus Dactylopiibacterium carminicum TaxID=857335 RepID=A0A272EVI5_9RHOO|nr:flagellar protein FlaG [Candidatus Dactylopiibacterium carminicum]KAF7598165.1 hypothetical protein BGI27_14675 [Candidatus Dactylopiibacterium carminicum]PAS94112.1 MAG: hypothetical protein CGU29_05595 [Candidatus Dactylopiibacterium carminicum]PAS96852.1 MAG: hypothetical protein BSR46_14715 [Candidatus Dactylopiibacterium carminicum]PAS98124.1 MAG: hypothetical protein CGU28_01980 [Candidatus Dactylopiibacterium carminicum]
MAMQPIPTVPNVATGSRGVDTQQTRASDTTARGVVSPELETLNVVRQEQTAENAVTPQPSRAEVERAMQEVQNSLPPVARNLQFSVDEETGRSTAAASSR